MSADASFAAPGHRPAARDDALQTLAAALCGLLLPLYLFDESVALKAALSPAIPASVLFWILVSRFDGGVGSATWRLAIVALAVTFTGSVIASMLGEGVTINAFYPFLFIALCMRQPHGIRAFATALFAALLVVTLVGWYRFVTVTGGTVVEHGFGYWGIKYTASTRNSDALAPMLLSSMALVTLLRLPAGAAPGRRLALWIALAVALPALALTFSRGAWIAVLLLLLSSSGTSWRVLVRMALLLAIAGTVLLALAAIVAPDTFSSAVDLVALLQRVQSIYDPEIQSSNDERARLLTYAVEVGLEHPLFGAGAARFNCCAAQLGFPELADNLHPENIFLHLFSEYGLLPAVSTFMILVMAAWRGLRSDRSAPRLAGAALAAFIVWLQLNSELPSLFIWSLLGVLCSVAVHRQARRAARVL